MPIIDFKEIADATKGEARDSFELFARDFLQMLGYKVLAGPDRGADGGRDLILEETRSGIGGETRIRWLVSCKHKAQSGNSVTPTDEQDIFDRVRSHTCEGFIGFYSTLASTGLSAKLEGQKSEYEQQIFDRERIEHELLKTPQGMQLARRYFPISVATWGREHPTPAALFSDSGNLLCEYCNRNLLEPEPHGIVTSYEPMNDRKTVELLWCCKGNCDHQLENLMHKRNLISSWRDISDLTIPTVFIAWVMATLNQIHSGAIWSDKAFHQVKTLMLKIFPYVSRHLTDEEKAEIASLSMMPSYMGGGLTTATNDICSLMPCSFIACMTASSGGTLSM